jgi:hypothetical protein
MQPRSTTSTIRANTDLAVEIMRRTKFTGDSATLIVFSPVNAISAL